MWKWLLWKIGINICMTGHPTDAGWCRKIGHHKGRHKDEFGNEWGM
jgi:hypothetical protein